MESPTVLPECLALATLRRSRKVSSVDLASSLGIQPPSMSKYENSMPAPPDRLEQILAALSYKVEDYRDLVDVLSRRSVDPRPVEAPPPVRTPLALTPVDPTPEEWGTIRQEAVRLGRVTEAEVLHHLSAAVRLRKTDAARAEAAGLCDRLLAEPKPWLAVEVVGELQTWAVAEALAHRSAEVAPEDPERALELSAYAVRVAELAPAGPVFRQRLRGYVLTFRENALRAARRLAEAEEVFALAEALWSAGAEVPGPLAEWRRLSLEGSLRRDQQRFAESLARLDASLALAPAKARGPLLVTKALTVEKLGDPEQAVLLLQEAEAAAGRQKDARLAFFAIANHSALLCRLGRFALAKIELDKLVGLLSQGKAIGPDLQRTWVRWIRGSVAAGLGHWKPAVSDLAAAARAFAEQKAAWEQAMVSLELAVLLCRERKLLEVDALVRGLERIIENEKLSTGARAALAMLCEAAARSEVTLDTATKALDLFQRAPKADASSVEGQVDRGRSSGVITATSIRIHDAAAVDHLAGRGPEGGHPGDQLLDQPGGLSGLPVGREDG